MKLGTNYMAQQAAKRSRNINLWIRFHGIEECGRTDCCVTIKVEFFWVPIDGPTAMCCENKAVYKNEFTPEAQLRKKHHSISYDMARESVRSRACRIDLFTKLFPKPRREYILNKFAY